MNDSKPPPDPTRASSSAARWGQLQTEQRHPRSLELDRLPSGDIVRLLLEEDRHGLDRAIALTAEIAAAAEEVAEVLGREGTVVFAGAGTSGRLGVLEAAECPPTFGSDPARIRAVIAGGEDAVFGAKEGAEDRADDGRTAVADLGSGDLLIALSASSVTPYARGALTAAREQGATTQLITCAPAEGLESVADRLIALATGPEILTGSTRLKAGSATKAVLNAITTAAMVRLGKTYGNLMVDLRPGSAKLRDRAVRIVATAAEIEPAAARSLLAQADGEVKTAIVMGLCGVGVEVARQRIAGAGGHVRAAADAAGKK